MIVLDPGHGGIDPGAQASGVREKDLALIYALTLAGELARLGIQADLTRDRDEMPGGGTVRAGLIYRAQFANQLHAAAFVSIHFNASSNSPSTRGLWLLHAAGASGGRSLAEALGAALGGRVLPDDSEHTDGQRLAVLRHTAMPAVLVEVGFVTSPEERAQLVHVAHLRAFVAGAAAGLQHWLKAH